MFDSLSHSLNLKANFSSESTAKLFSEVKYKEIEKGKILTPFESVEKKIYFIIEGALRLYAIIDEKEVTFDLKFENDYTNSYKSFVDEKPSNLALAAIEDSKILTLTKRKYERLCLQIPELNVAARIIIENVLVERLKRETALQLHDYDERFLNLVKNNPKILKRVPNYMIATYLNMTPETLSRIKRRNT